MPDHTPHALEAWFTHEILPHEAALTRFLSARRRASRDTQDLRHDIYIRVLESAAKSLPTSPRAFLFTTARNLLIDHARHQRIVPIDRLEDLDLTNVLNGDLSAERHASGRQQLQRLARLFDRLPQRCREVLWARRIEGLSQLDTAERLGIAKATVDRHLARGLKILTDALGGAPSEKEGIRDDRVIENEPNHGE